MGSLQHAADMVRVVCDRTAQTAVSLSAAGHLRDRSQRSEYHRLHEVLVECQE